MLVYQRVVLNSPESPHFRSRRTSLGGSAIGLAFFHATLRRRRTAAAPCSTARRSLAQPIFCSALSSQGDWRAAVAELVAEAPYQLQGGKNEAHVGGKS